VSDGQMGGNLVKASPEPLVETILNLQFPAKPVMEAIQGAYQAYGSERMALPTIPGMNERRAQLSALSEDELRRLHGELLAAKQRQEQARASERSRRAAEKAAAEEAAKFYNQPQAQPNYAYWLRLDFWTFDEAIALLLGKSPNVVTWEAVRRAMDPPRWLASSKPAPTRFLAAYMTLRNIALRADAMTSTQKLRPASVAAWAMQRLDLKLPEPLRALVAETSTPTPLAPPSPPGAAPAVVANAQPCDSDDSEPERAPVLVKRAALRAMSHRWPTVENDLRHADRNGLTQAAKAEEYGMWREQDALEWARRHGKLKYDRSGSGLENLPRRVFRAGD